MMFFINHTEIGSGSTAIIEFDGPLNSESTPDFDDYINKLISNGIIYLLLDMQNLKYISSEGIGAALMIQKSIEEKNGVAVFFNLNNEIKSLFKLLGFDKVFTISSDRAEALEIIDRRMELFPQHDIHDSTNSIVEPHDFDIPFDKDDILEPDSTLPEIPEEPELSEEESLYEPFIIECLKCRSLIRVREEGEQICPYCETEFTVTGEKKAVFKFTGN